MCFLECLRLCISSIQSSWDRATPRESEGFGEIGTEHVLDLFIKNDVSYAIRILHP